MFNELQRTPLWGTCILFQVSLTMGLFEHTFRECAFTLRGVFQDRNNHFTRCTQKFGEF
jgi:hypothetical protein